MELSDSAMDLLCEEGYDPMFGARPLKRAIQRLIQNPLSKKILTGNYPPGSKVFIDVVDSKLTIN
jgi:ATP-dependent Clp protease ATP-binding subunit ClpB